MSEKEALNALYGVYCSLYDDQLEGADDDYLDYFESGWAPPNKPWETKEEAKAAFESLVGELYEDCNDVEELLDTCGLNQELIEFFGLDI